MAKIEDFQDIAFEEVWQKNHQIPIISTHGVMAKVQAVKHIKEKMRVNGKQEVKVKICEG